MYQSKVSVQYLLRKLCLREGILLSLIGVFVGGSGVG